VLADAYDDGWRATVDGAPAPVLRANRAMRAVPIDAGEHVVEFHYRSAAFEVGAWISGLGWLAVAGALATSWRRRKGAARRADVS
jgi:uncharacterized membrane protein YfhO